MDHKSFFLFDFCLIARYSLRLSIFFSFFPLSSSSLANRRTFPPLIPFAHHFKSTLLFLHTLARKKVARIVYLLFHLRFFAPLSFSLQFSFYIFVLAIPADRAQTAFNSLVVGQGRRGMHFFKTFRSLLLFLRRSTTGFPLFPTVTRN